MTDYIFNCPHCQQLLEASENLLGESIECPSCKGSIQLPEPEVAANAPSETSPPTASKGPPPLTDFIAEIPREKHFKLRVKISLVCFAIAGMSAVWGYIDFPRSLQGTFFSFSAHINCFIALIFLLGGPFAEKLLHWLRWDSPPLKDLKNNGKPTALQKSTNILVVLLSISALWALTIGWIPFSVAKVKSNIFISDHSARAIFCVILFGFIPAVLAPYCARKYRWAIATVFYVFAVFILIGFLANIKSIIFGISRHEFWSETILWYFIGSFAIAIGALENLILLISAKRKGCLINQKPEVDFKSPKREAFIEAGDATDSEISIQQTVTSYYSISSSHKSIDDGEPEKTTAIPGTFKKLAALICFVIVILGAYLIFQRDRNATIDKSAYAEASQNGSHTNETQEICYARNKIEKMKTSEKIKKYLVKLKNPVLVDFAKKRINYLEKQEEDSCFFNALKTEIKTNIYTGDSYKDWRGQKKCALDYIKKYPNGRYLWEARDIMDEMTYNEANSFLKVRKYLQEYPNGRKSAEAKRIINPFKPMIELVEAEKPLAEIVDAAQKCFSNPSLSDEAKKKASLWFAEIMKRDEMNNRARKAFQERLKRKPARMDVQILACIMNKYVWLHGQRNIGSGIFEMFEAFPHYVQEVVPTVTGKVDCFLCEKGGVDLLRSVKFLHCLDEFSYHHGRIPIDKKHYTFMYYRKYTSHIPKLDMKMKVRTLDHSGGTKTTRIPGTGRMVRRWQSGQPSHQRRTEHTIVRYKTKTTHSTVWKQQEFIGEMIFVKNHKSLTLTKSFISRDPSILTMQKKGYQRKNHLQYLSQKILEVLPSKAEAVNSAYAPLYSPSEWENNPKMKDFLEGCASFFVAKTKIYKTGFAGTSFTPTGFKYCKSWTDFIAQYPDSPLVKGFIDGKWDWDEAVNWFNK